MIRCQVPLLINISIKIDESIGFIYHVFMMLYIQFTY